MKYQFTFYDTTNTYMPVTATINVTDTKEKFSSMKRRATMKVMIEHSWTIKDLTEKYHYTKIRFRKVD